MRLIRLLGAVVLTGALSGGAVAVTTTAGASTTPASTTPAAASLLVTTASLAGFPRPGVTPGRALRRLSMALGGRNVRRVEAPSATPSSQVQPDVVTPDTWSIVPSPDVAGTTTDDLEGVSCVGSSFCVAVGGSYVGTVTTTAVTTLIEQWNGTAWSVVPSPDLSSSTGALLSGVSCISTTFCVATGLSDTAATKVVTTLIEQWNGTAWSVVPSPDPSTGKYAGLTSVSCTSTTFCVATGLSITGTKVVATLIEQWNGTAWSVVPSPDPSTGKYAGLTSVSCTSTTFCVATGLSITGTTAAVATLIEQWNGTAWSIVPSPSLGTTDGGDLVGISCSSSTQCVAVGAGYQRTTPSTPTLVHDTNLVEQWNGIQWRVVTVPGPSGTGEDLLNGVDCFGPTSCVAVGAHEVNGTTGTFVTEALTWNGTTWTLATTPNTTTTTPQNSFHAVSCVAGATCTAVGVANGRALVESAPVTRSGYYEVASDGGLFSFGTAFYGSMGGKPLNEPVVGMAVTPDGGGYWEVASDGGIFAFGDAAFYGSMGGKPLNKPIVGIAATPDGGGYWEVASDGGIFSFGDAQFFGSMGGKSLNQPVVGLASTPDGQGYYEVASDGGIFTFGDAVFQGSMGGKSLDKPVVGIAVAPTGGYYEVASDGGIFSYGVPFLGSMGGKPLNEPVVGISVSPTGGYYEVASDGGLFAFGAPFLGSMGGKPLNEPVVAIAE